MFHDTNGYCTIKQRVFHETKLQNVQDLFRPKGRLRGFQDIKANLACKNYVEISTFFTKFNKLSALQVETS